MWHDRAVTDHLLQVALRHCHQPDHEHVAPDRQAGEPMVPGRCASRQQGQRELNQAVQAELLQDAGMQHRRGARRRAVAERRPGMEWPEGDQDAEAKQEKPENVPLRHGRDRLLGKHQAQGDKVEAVRSALHIDRDQPEQRQHRPAVR